MLTPGDMVYMHGDSFAEKHFQNDYNYTDHYCTKKPGEWALLVAVIDKSKIESWRPVLATDRCYLIMYMGSGLLGWVNNYHIDPKNILVC